MKNKQWTQGGIVLLVMGLALHASATPAPDSQTLLQQSLAELKAAPSDDALRERIIKLVLTTNSPPSVPPETFKAEGAAEYALAHAKNPADFQEAATQYEIALAEAPWIAGDYLKLGQAREKAGLLKTAAQSYRFYLMAAPDAKDKDLIQKQIDELEHPVSDQEAFLRKLDGSRYISKDIKHDQWLILSIHGHKITEGAVDIEQYGAAPSQISSNSLTGREFTLPKRSWCDHGFHCDAVGTISEDGQTIILKRTEPPSEGGREIVLTYKLQPKGALFQ